MGMVHNKEVHGVILKKKWKQLKSLQQFVWLSTCSPEAASSTEHMLSLVHLSHGSAEAEGQVPTFCKMPLQPDPDLQLLSSQAGSTGNSVLTRFLLFLPRKEERNDHLILVPKPLGFAICETAPVTWKKGLCQGNLGSLVCPPHPLGERKEHPSPVYCARLQPICPALLVGPYISHHWFFQHPPLKGEWMGMQVKLQQLFSLYLQTSHCPAKTPSERTGEKILYW